MQKTRESVVIKKTKGRADRENTPERTKDDISKHMAALRDPISEDI